MKLSVKLLLKLFLFVASFMFVVNCDEDTTPNSGGYIKLKTGLAANYTIKVGEKLKLECEYESNDEINTVYWIRNLEEIIQSKKGRIQIMRKNMTSTLLFRKIELLDQGSYSCYAENRYGNATSETLVTVVDQSSNNKLLKQNRKQSLNDDAVDYLSQLSDSDDISDEFPMLNPTIIENTDDKGFCEPYKGSICAGIISNYSIYSTGANQQDQIEERLKSILPLLTNKNTLSKRCSTFAIPSLCLFAFPLCDQHKVQPKQICRLDCKQLQQDICKDEYFNIKSLFDHKLNSQPQSSFLIDCNQLPPSSDTPNECLPVVTMTIEKLQSTYIKQVPVNIETQKCILSNGADYRGTQSYTISGKQCIKWEESTVYRNNYKYNPELSGHNYCRNIDNDIEPWCFTVTNRKEYCGIPRCTIAAINGGGLDDKKLANLLYIVVPSICIPLVLLCMFLTICYCKRANKTTNSTIATSNTGTSNNNLNSNSKLRMSNASISKNKGVLHNNNKYSHSGKTSSSKSSVTSSVNNMELNPFLQKQHQIQQQQAYIHNEFFSNGYVSQHGLIPTTQSTSSEYGIKQFTSNNIRLLQEIGKGRFGKVYIGELIGSLTPTSVIKVIVKTLDEKNTIENTINNEQEFLHELNVFSNLKHRNLCNLIGIHMPTISNDDTNNQQVLFNDTNNIEFPRCMILEYLCNGDLHEYLLQRGCANTSLSISSGSTGMTAQNRNVADFLYLSQQIALGMEFLAAHNFVHKDLAARNILLGDNLTIKICDVAQYTEKYSKDYYKFQSKVLPVRWMSPESLIFGRFAQDTDVYSYGVVLWEIFNYGVTPYSGCTNPEVIQMIRDRKLLMIPDECPQRAYQLMLECWHENSVQRPTFTDIVNRLKNWENYYSFNANTYATYGTSNGVCGIVSSMQLANGNVAGNGVAAYTQMTNSYSTNSQNSKSSSSNGCNNTGSTGFSSSSPLSNLPPPPPAINCYSPNKNFTVSSLFNGNNKFNKNQNPSPPSSTVTSVSSNRIYREIETNTNRASQRGALITCTATQNNNFIPNV